MVGNEQDFLELSDEEAMIIAVRAGLAMALRKARQERRWTQAQLAEELGSSQSRVAKMEAADPSVSIDLLVRSLIVSGASGKTIGAVFSHISQRKAARKSA